MAKNVFSVSDPRRLFWQTPLLLCIFGLIAFATRQLMPQPLLYVEVFHARTYGGSLVVRALSNGDYEALSSFDGRYKVLLRSKKAEVERIISERGYPLELPAYYSVLQGDWVVVDSTHTFSIYRVNAGALRELFVGRVDIGQGVVIFSSDSLQAVRRFVGYFGGDIPRPPFVPLKKKRILMYACLSRILMVRLILLVIYRGLLLFKTSLRFPH